jgi:trigger factor
LKVEFKELDGLARELVVDIEASEVKKQLDKLFTEVRKGAELKGFRKGKAPLDMIKSKFGDQVKAEAIDELIRSTLPGAIKEKELKAATAPSITDVDFKEDGSLSYTAQVEVFPELGEVKFDGLEVTTVPTEPKDEEVAEMTESLLHSFADFRDVEAPAKADDLLTADLKKLDDPSGALETDLFEDARIDLAAPMTVKEFKEQLVGLKAGDEKEISVTYPTEYADPVFAGHTIKYLCTVKGVQERVLPEFNDALAKRTKQAETALELKLKMREDIGRQKEDIKRKIHRNLVVGQLVDQNPLELPKKMVSDYLDAVIKDRQETEPELDEAAMRTDYQDVAVRTLRWNLLFHQVAEQEKIEVLPSDTENLIKRFATEYKMTEQQAKEALAQSGKLSSLNDSLLEDKVLDFLVSQAKVVEGQPTNPTAGTKE